MFINSGDLIWVVFSAMFFANISIFFLGWLQTKTVVHLLRIPFHFLAPAILMMATVGAYAIRGLTVDVVVMFIAGIVGFFLRRSGYSVAGIVLGIILGKIGEQTFAQAMQMVHYDFVAYMSRPITLILILAAVGTTATSVLKALKGPAKSEKAASKL